MPTYLELFSGQLHATVEATAGQIIIVPAGTPHKFTNTGATIAHHTDIHTRGQMQTTWLED
jgi:mannose-6-phosphate isomerase-like protein (cupin superfamily)